MGTTLAFNGAYNLAGCIMQFPNDHETAFTNYESSMRPLVERAQKLVPGAPHILYPETKWGVAVIYYVMRILSWPPISELLFMFVGPPADSVPVKDYDFIDPKPF
jgi:2-polyprenyl-6-methoxyphenol hydroxylase-like FAD-dependent oxidoreductase